MDDRQKAFNDVCREYGFDADDYEREFKTYGKTNGLKLVRLVGFEGAMCLLEIKHKGKVPQNAPKYLRELPSDCMRHIRLYYRDLAQSCREEGLVASADFYDRLADRMTKKMKRAGWTADPIELFNAWGNPEKAKICICPGKPSSIRNKYI